jgi:hypothetical protein
MSYFNALNQMGKHGKSDDPEPKLGSMNMQL